MNTKLKLDQIIFIRLIAITNNLKNNNNEKINKIIIPK